MRVPPPPPLSPDDATKRFDLEPPSLDVVPKGKDDPDALSAALETVLQDCRRTGTTAVIAHTDYHAARLVEVAESMNMAIPRDLALIAYDDELADSARVPLTALTAPRLEVGRTALALLLERLDPPGVTQRCVTSSCCPGSRSASPVDAARPARVAGG